MKADGRFLIQGLHVFLERSRQIRQMSAEIATLDCSRNGRLSPRFQVRPRLPGAASSFSECRKLTKASQDVSIFTKEKMLWTCCLVEIQHKFGLAFRTFRNVRRFLCLFLMSR